MSVCVSCRVLCVLLRCVMCAWVGAVARGVRVGGPRQLVDMIDAGGREHQDRVRRACIEGIARLSLI
eukprot:3083823-Prymnesium_polylepis.2